MKSTLRIALALFATIALAAPLSAQSRSLVEAPSPELTVRAPAPVLPTAAASVDAEASADPTVPVQSMRGQGRDVAMMVVGGAAIIIGSVIGGDTGTIVMAGGAVVGLLGLYGYVR